MVKVDLHIHTDFSDGIRTPEDIIEELNNKKDNYIISFADHFIFTFEKPESRRNVFILPGIELCAYFKGKSIHLLGYSLWPDIKDELEKHNLEMCKQFNNRAVKIVNRIEEQSFKFNWNFLVSIETIFKYNLAQAFLKSNPELRLRTPAEVINKYKDLFYVKEENFYPPVKEVSKLLHKSNFRVVLAHPGNEELKNIQELKKLGIDGIETTLKHDQTKIRSIDWIAEKYGLFRTSGSDYHGKGTFLEKYNFIDHEI